MLHSWALGCLEMLRHRPVSWTLAPLYRAWPEHMGSGTYRIVSCPSKLFCIFWKYWNFPQIPASFFGLKWCFLNLDWCNHECWSPLDPNWNLFKCCLAPFYSAMDTKETAASQSNTGMFCSMLSRLRHVVLVYSMGVRKGTQGHEACRLKKPDLPGFIFIFYIGTKPWHALFSSSCLQFFFSQGSCLVSWPSNTTPQWDLEW